MGDRTNLNQWDRPLPKNLDRFKKWITQLWRPSEYAHVGAQELIFEMSWNTFSKWFFIADSEKSRLNSLACGTALKKAVLWYMSTFLSFMQPSRYFEIFSVKKRVLNVEKVLFVISIKRRIKISIKRSKNQSYSSSALATPRKRRKK